MRIYNTLTGRKEEFPIEEFQNGKKVRMYVCGPTVYNLLHVGNMRCYVVFDTVRRYLESKGCAVTLVQNFTDIDDKIIQRANEEGTTPATIAEKYISEAKVDTKKLNIKEADHYPQVTKEIDNIIELITQLIEKGYAYEQNGHVFFATQKSDDYGKLSKKKVDDLLAGARVEINTDKRSPVDFVLWKPHKPGEPAWDSPWGQGRPGWHIECSAMSRKYLGEHVDIHGGGEDLIFPHHENEIAQSEAANGVSFVRYWMHNNSLTSGYKKMSKSLGNFFTFREEAEKYHPMVIRFLLLSGHYRVSMEYNEGLLQAAEKGFNRIKNCHYALRQILEEATGEELWPPTTEDEQASFAKEDQCKEAFEASMEDDFNTANAISAIFELVKLINTRMQNEISARVANKLQNDLGELCGILGLELEDPHDTFFGLKPSEVEEIESLIAQRQEAKVQKNWTEADRIRGLLLSKYNVTLEDTPTGARWTRK